MPAPCTKALTVRSDSRLVTKLSQEGLMAGTLGAATLAIWCFTLRLEKLLIFAPCQ